VPRRVKGGRWRAKEEPGHAKPQRRRRAGLKEISEGRLRRVERRVSST